MSKLPSIANLMSPPEATLLDGFSITPSKTHSTSRPSAYSSDSTLAPMAKCTTPDTKMRILPSPPISPAMAKRYKEEKDGLKDMISGSQEAVGVKDPVLYPDTGSFDSVGEEPLFPTEPTVVLDDIITKHKLMHMTQFDKKVHRPSDEEYRLALACVPKIGFLFNQNPVAYLKRQREENDKIWHKTKRICAGPGVRPTPIAIAPAPKPTKRAIVRATPLKTPLQRVKRTPRPSPMSKLMNFPAKGRSETPDRLPGTKREDVDYNSLPDYAPPTSTLPTGNPKILKIDWQSNNALNLSNDPDRHMLHEAEIYLASGLRLSCATYMCSKRRIFEARLNALRIGKEFRKTDAQQACKIDVNKASKLWVAFDKVGWFAQAHFLQFL